MLKRIGISPEELYQKEWEEIEGEEAFGNMVKDKLNLSLKAFYSIWLPYKIRCRYFHNNTAVPLFSYADESLLTVLQYTNYFVESFLEENLSEWLTDKEPSEDQMERIRNAFLQIRKK